MVILDDDVDDALEYHVNVRKVPYDYDVDDHPIWPVKEKSHDIADFVGKRYIETRSSWVNCVLRDEEAVYWVSVAHYEAVSVGN